VRDHTRPVLDALLRRSPAQPLFHWRAARSLAVIAYHEIRDGERFSQQLDYIRRAAHPVTLDDVIRAAEGRAGLPARAVLVTFDDGHRDVLEVAMPMLSERQIPAVAFVVVGLIGSDAPHWWTEVKALVRAGGSADAIDGADAEGAVRALKRLHDDVRLASLTQLRRTAQRRAPRVPQLTPAELGAMESAGIAIGNHSLTHPCLSNCETEKIREEVERSHEILTEALGHPPDAFAYPDGDRDTQVTNVVRRTGYRSAFLFDHRLSAQRLSDPLNISRLRLDTDTGFDRFRIVVSGLHPTIHRLRGLS